MVKTNEVIAPQNYFTNRNLWYTKLWKLIKIQLNTTIMLYTSIKSKSENNIINKIITRNAVIRKMTKAGEMQNSINQSFLYFSKTYSL